MEELAVSNDLLERPEALAERAQEQGYLFLRGLVDRDALHHVRADILGLCAGAGWLAEGADPVDGIAAPGRIVSEGLPEYMAVYNEVMKLESFHTLAHDPSLLAVFRSLFGETPLPHARNIARIVFPHNTAFTTPAHQDFVHVQGTTETWTAWFPLGDCPQALGSLAVMPRSHRSGIFPVHSAYGAGGLGIDTESLPFEWRASDFAAGDVVIFHSHTVHKALPNLSEDRIRLSVDYRYQAISQPAAEASFLPHFAQVTWEEVYAGWKSDRLKYYWRDVPLRYVEWTPEYHQSAAQSAGSKRE